jgi:hypothetical protein
LAAFGGKETELVRLAKEHLEAENGRRGRRLGSKKGAHTLREKSRKKTQKDPQEAVLRASKRHLEPLLAARKHEEAEEGRGRSGTNRAGKFAPKPSNRLKRTKMPLETILKFKMMGVIFSEKMNPGGKRTRFREYFVKKQRWIHKNLTKFERERDAR